MNQDSCLTLVTKNSYRRLQAQSRLLQNQVPALLQDWACFYEPRLSVCPGARLGSMDTDSRLVPLESGSWPAQIPDWLLRTQAHGQPQCQAAPHGPNLQASISSPRLQAKFCCISPPPGLQGPGLPHGPKCQPTLINPSTSPAQPLTQAPGLPT